MSVTAPVFDKSDPKVVNLYPFHLPLTPEWEEKKDFFGQSSMMGAGAGMFLKNPIMVWGSLVSSVMALVNYEPIRAPKDSQSPLFSVGMGVAGLLTVNLPKLLLPANVAVQSTVA